MSTWIKPVTDKIRSFAELPVDFNGYGGAPACEKAIAFAVALCEAVADDVPEPTVVNPICNGVYLRWTRENGSWCDIEVDNWAVNWDCDNLLPFDHDDLAFYGEDFTYNVDAAAKRVRRFFQGKCNEHVPRVMRQDD